MADVNLKNNTHVTHVNSQFEEISPKETDIGLVRIDYSVRY